MHQIPAIFENEFGSRVMLPSGDRIFRMIYLITKNRGGVPRLGRFPGGVRKAISSGFYQLQIQRLITLPFQFRPCSRPESGSRPTMLFHMLRKDDPAGTAGVGVRSSV